MGTARSAASRILPDVILTLVHSTRLLPWVVKIMSVPRSVSRATVAPYTRHQLKARWNRLKGREIAGPAIDGRCTKKQRLVADASGHECGASPDTKKHESGLPRIPSHSRLERFVKIRVRRKPGSCPTMRRSPKGSARVPRLARRSLKPERGAHGEYRRKTIRRIVGFRGRA